MTSESDELHQLCFMVADTAQVQSRMAVNQPDDCSVECVKWL